MRRRLHVPVPAQIGVHMPSRLFAMARRHAHGLLTRNHVAPCEQAWMAGHHIFVDFDGPVVA